MDKELKENIQQKMKNISVICDNNINSDLPDGFLPWTCNISPSALYNQALPLRKKMRIKTPETKWTSIKRWSNITPSGIELPDGVYYWIKRHERFVSDPSPQFVKTEYILMLMPYGNVYRTIGDDEPITEEWLFSNGDDGKMMIEKLIELDAANPIIGYFESVYDYMIKNPDQIGIHLRRKINK